MEKEVSTAIETFKKCIDYKQEWDIAILLVEYYTVEKGTGSCSLQISASGKLNEINYSVIDDKYDLINKILPDGSDKWNKAILSLFKDGTYHIKSWWDSEFQKSLYGEDEVS